VKKLKTSLVEEILKIRTTLLESFGKPEIKYTIIESKERKLLQKTKKYHINVNKCYTMIQ
jgi:hypothetical protein